VIENLGQLYLGMGIGSISGAMAAAVAALLFNPLHSRISDWAERRFQHDLVLLKRELPELLERESGRSSARQLAALVLPQITEALHSTRAALLLDGAIAAARDVEAAAARRWARAFLARKPVPAQADQADTLFPVRLRLGGCSGVAGWLLLGPRPDGSLYGRDERRALQSLLPALAHAFAETRNRALLSSRQRSQLQRTRKELKDLGMRVRAIESVQPKPFNSAEFDPPQYPHAGRGRYSVPSK
jgi:hypothetical protein